MAYKINKILVLFNPKKENTERVIRKIEKYLINKKIYVMDIERKEKEREFDLVITLGGDGTLLTAVHLYPSALFLGIHMGRVGFLCQVNKEEIDYALKKLTKGEIFIEKKGVINFYSGKKIFWGLNDIVIKGDSQGRLMEFELVVDNTTFDYLADGVLFSTPTGSTAYNLALNGPLLDNELDAYLVNIIAPFNVFSRPFIIKGKKEISFYIKGKTSKGIMFLDGQIEHEIPINKKFKVKIGKPDIKFIHLKDSEKSVYKRLKEKLNF